MAVDQQTKFTNFFTETTVHPSHTAQLYHNYPGLKTESSFHHICHLNDIVYHQIPSRKRSIRAPRLISTNPISTSAASTSTSAGLGCGATLGFFGGDLHFQILQQQLDRLISHHMEKMRMEIEERKKQQLREIMATIEESISTKLRQKEQELSKIGGLNWSLQEKIKSLYLENQIWRDLAHTNEETANTLRTNLHQVLQQMNNNNVEPATANDAVSCCGSCGGGDGGEDEEGDSQEWVKKRKVGKEGGDNNNNNNNNNSSLLLGCTKNSGWVYRGKNVESGKL